MGCSSSENVNEKCLPNQQIDNAQEEVKQNENQPKELKLKNNRHNIKNQNNKLKPIPKRSGGSKIWKSLSLYRRIHGDKIPENAEIKIIDGQYYISV